MLNSFIKNTSNLLKATMTKAAVHSPKYFIVENET
jgi:hypothetical protein